jgi:hypothetical protein
MYTILPSSAQCRWLAATLGVPVGPLLATEREEHHTAGVPPRRGKGPLGSQDQPPALGIQLLNRGEPTAVMGA